MNEWMLCACVSAPNGNINWRMATFYLFYTLLELFSLSAYRPILYLSPSPKRLWMVASLATQHSCQTPRRRKWASLTACHPCITIFHSFSIHWECPIIESPVCHCWCVCIAIVLFQQLLLLLLLILCAMAVSFFTVASYHDIEIALSFLYSLSFTPFFPRYFIVLLVVVVLLQYMFQLPVELNVLLLNCRHRFFVWFLH